MDGNNEQAQVEPESLESGDLNALAQLSRENAAGADPTQTPAPQKPKKTGLKRVFGFLNVYLLIFLLLVVIAGAVAVVSYINSQKQPVLPSAALQNLTQSQLSQISSGSDSTVGDPRYILNVQSDAVFAGNALIRGDLNVAGSVQMGKGLTIPSLTVSGASNLNSVQVNSLTTAGDSVLQGKVTVNNELNVAKGATFGGAVSIPQLSVGSLVLGGSGSLTLTNHLKTGGATPSRSNGSALGGGGTASNNGSDTAGTVTINTGNSPQAGCFITLGFSQKFTGTPHVMITPASPAAGNTNYYVQRSTGSFSICASTNPPGGSNIVFDYFIVD